jgi:predicted GIY-YIG superfamily endonuclease
MALEEEKQFFVYLLESTNQSTYVGATVDLTKRLRQHNKEIKGGAVATSIKVQK